jgi:hypothetical protein
LGRHDAARQETAESISKVCQKLEKHSVSCYDGFRTCSA